MTSLQSSSTNDNWNNNGIHGRQVRQISKANYMFTVQLTQQKGLTVLSTEIEIDLPILLASLRPPFLHTTILLQTKEILTTLNLLIVR